MVDFSTAYAEEIRNGIPSSRSRGAPMGFALWEFCGTEWRLRKDASVEGAVPGQPPRGAGLYVGQIRAVPSVAAEA